MAEETEIQITGIDQVLSNLDATKRKLALGRAAAAAVVPIVRELLMRTPVDHGDLKAHLMSDIQVQSAGEGVIAQVGYGREGYKARLVEFGHRMVGHKPGKKESGHVPAKPFMRPAFDASAGKAVEAFEEVIMESVEGGL